MYQANERLIHSKTIAKYLQVTLTKKIEEGEVGCRFAITLMYIKTMRLLLTIDFMKATATQAEIEKFTLAVK